MVSSYTAPGSLPRRSLSEPSVLVGSDEHERRASHAAAVNSAKKTAARARKCTEFIKTFYHRGGKGSRRRSLLRLRGDGELYHARTLDDVEHVHNRAVRHTRVRLQHDGLVLGVDEARAQSGIEECVVDRLVIQMNDAVLVHVHDDARLVRAL